LRRGVPTGSFLRIETGLFIQPSAHPRALKSFAPENSLRRDRFAGLALAYLLLPSLVFLLTWVRPGIGIPTALVVAASFLWFLRTNDTPGSRPAISNGSWIFILVLALVWTFLAGVGGFVPQTSDYEKHNLAYHDLLGQSWPVRYDGDTGSYFMCYGLGYYLVPALAARLAGAAWLPALTLAWGFIGVALFFYWVATFSRSPKKTLGLFLLFATTETLWHMFLHLLHNPHFAAQGQPIRESLTRLGIESVYSDNFMSLQYRPQHVISAWLGAALFYELFWVRHNPRGAALVWAACIAWSPLMCLGLLLVPVTALGQWRWRDLLEPVNVGGGILLAVLAVYFQGHVPLTEKGPIWKFSHGAEWLVLYPWFLLLQLTPMLFIYLADRKYRLLDGFRPLFLGSFALLLLLPLYKIGYYGDQRLQGGTPALVFAALAACRIFEHQAFSIRRPLFALLVATQLVGAIYPFGKWWWQCLDGQAVDYSFEAVKQRYGYENLSQFKRYGYDYASQYLGRTNSLANEWMLKPAETK